jgi:outer membrane protein assembly factor BamB
MNKQKLRFGLVVFVACALLIAACDWNQLGYGPARTGLNPTETAINVSNVQQLGEAWATSTPTGTASPIVAGQKLVLVDSGDPFEGVLGTVKAFDAVGKVNCSGTPKVCEPLWRATFQGYAAVASAVADGVVFVATSNGLLAFDLAGKQGCSGTPTICAPLWTATTEPLDIASPLVSNGIVYVGGSYGYDTFYAFDAHGQRNCAGSPRVCAPLWTATTGNLFAAPAEANGVVYVVNNDPTLYAFDADGVSNCAGTPKTCMPLWRAHPAQSGGHSGPMVAHGVVYLSDGVVTAYDAGGVTNCSGTPKTCTPLWDTPYPAGTNYTGIAAAGPFVYASKFSPGGVDALDAAGIAGCSGTPKRCTPLWSATVSHFTNSAPSIANGVLFVGGENTLSAFDAAGVRNCSGIPKACTPLWSGAGSGGYSPVIANGVVYVNDGARVRAYALP